MADAHDDHPSNFLRLSNSDPDLTLQLSLGGVGSSSTLAVGGQAPMPNGITGGDDQKGKALFEQLQPPAMKRSFGDGDDDAAGRRQVMSWKKRAREFGIGAGQAVMPDPAVPLHVLMPPPPPPRLPRAASDSAHHNTAFRRAVSVVKTAIDRHRAARNSTTAVAPPPKEFMMIRSPGHDHDHPDMISTAAFMQTSSRKNVPLERGAAAHSHSCEEHVNKHKLNLDAPPPRTSCSSKSTNMMIKVTPTSSKNYLVKSSIKVCGQSSRDHDQELVGKKAKRVSFGGATMADQDEIERIIKIMPSVTTTGGIPNGRRIEGVLFKYLQGKVWIVCVCHGNLLSPEEFVQHAGGSDLTNAMKLIKVVRS